MKKVLCILLAVVLAFALFACAPATPDTPDNPDTPDTPVHTCESKCPECGKCLDAACTEDACKDKCEGHVPAHVCESKCPECGKCLNADCTEDACKDKCEGHNTVAETKNAVLVATFTANFRMAGTSSLVTAPEQIAVVDFGTTFSQDGVSGAVKFYTYADAANIPASMVSGPVKLGFNANGDLVSVEEIDGARLDVQPYQVTYADGAYTLADGTVLDLDTSALVDGNATHVIKKEQGLKINTCKINDTRFGLVTNSDDLYTLWDTDGNGSYDFARMVPLLNAGQIIMLDDKTITVRGGFGSSTSMYTWADGSVVCNYVFDDPALAGTLEKGDFVNFYFRWDSSAVNKPFGSMTAKLVIHSMADVKVGKIEAAEGEGVNLSTTVDGETYLWSDLIFESGSAGLFDGPGGATAGRTQMTEAHYGEEFHFVFDESGRIVYAFVPRDTYAITEVVLYATPGFNIRNSANKMLIQNPDTILVVADGDSVTEINAFEVTYIGEEDINYLVGLPVTLEKDADGNVTKVTLRGKAANYLPGECSVDGGAVFGKDGYALRLDAQALTVDFASHTYARRSFAYVSNFNVLTSVYGFAQNGDTMITLVDTDGDDMYDFARSIDIVNAVKLPLIIDNMAIVGDVVISGETSTILGSFGSVAATGWINGANMFQIEVPEGLELHDGDYVNGYIRIDYFSETNSHHQNLPATLVVTSVCEAKTGVFTDINFTDVNHITVKVDGVEMQWSDTTCVGAWTDGPAGAEGSIAGRTLMTADNNGKTFTYYCDDAGRIVLATLAD